MKWIVSLLFGIGLFQGVALQAELQAKLQELEESVQGLKQLVGNTDCGSKKILAYFNTGFLGDLDTEGVDYILFAFASVKPDDGSVYFDNENLEKLNKNLPVIEKLKKERPGLKSLISVGGYEASDNFPIVAADPMKRLKFVSTSDSLMQKYDFDGMDIDWEFTKCEDTPHYIDLVRAVRSGHPLKLLTVTMMRRPGRMACIDYTQLTPLVNHYNLLTYEYYGPWSRVTGFNTPLGHVTHEPCWLNIKDSTNVFLGLKGVPKEKVMLGLAFYGQQFSGTKGLYQEFKEGKRIDYKDIKNVDIAVYNPEAAAVYIQNEAEELYTTFDNAISIGAKCDYLLSKEVAGAVVWELGEDNNGELLSAVVSKLKPNQCKDKAVN